MIAYGFLIIVTAVLFVALWCSFGPGCDSTPKGKNNEDIYYPEPFDDL